MGKIANNAYTDASALEQSLPAMISALFRFVRNKRPSVPSRRSELRQSAVRAVPVMRQYTKVKMENTSKTSGAARRFPNPLKTQTSHTSNAKKIAAVIQRVR